MNWWIYWLNDWWIVTLNDWMIEWRNDWVIEWLNDWMIECLIAHLAIWDLNCDSNILKFTVIIKFLKFFILIIIYKRVE